MTKTLKSDLRKVLFTMISKFKEKQAEREVIFKQKQKCLLEISQCIENMDDTSGQVAENIKETIKKLSELFQKEILKTQNEHLDEISSLTDVSVSTLKRIKKEGQINGGVWNTPGKKRPHKPTVSALDSFDIDAIKNKINEFYIVKKQIPTLRSLLSELRESINFTGCRETLRRILLSHGYEFKQNKDERSILIERFDIAAWRHRFLRTIDIKRREGKEIVYLDETYVHQNYKCKKSWQGPSTSGVVTNISSGKRYIIAHAGSRKGFVPNALLVFSTKAKNADYHHDMNSRNFNKWISEKLIPNLNEPSVIVMDNASYHSVQVNKGPTTNTRKSDIQAWLAANGVPYEDYLTREELLVLAKDHKKEPVYQVDELLKQHGHEVLRLPPYHCDFNAIELIWSLAKRKIASKNIGLSAEAMSTLIEDSFNSITPEDWRKNTDHVIHVEEHYKMRDRITADMEEFIISVRENDSASESFDEVEFLDSDFDSD